MTALLLFLVLGISTTFWAIVGAGRVLTARHRRRPTRRPDGAAGGRAGPGHEAGPGRAGLGGKVTPADVAVLVAAHNEELVIADTIRAASRLVECFEHPHHLGRLEGHHR